MTHHSELDQAPFPLPDHSELNSLAPSPIPSSLTSSDRESIERAFYAAEREADWLHYPEHDPIFQLIPLLGSRPLTDSEEAARFWPHYDSERSEHSEDPSIDIRDEYPEIFEEAEQDKPAISPIRPR